MSVSLLEAEQSIKKVVDSLGVNVTARIFRDCVANMARECKTIDSIKPMAQLALFAHRIDQAAQEACKDEI